MISEKHASYATELGGAGSARRVLEAHADRALAGCEQDSKPLAIVQLYQPHTLASAALAMSASAQCSRLPKTVTPLTQNVSLIRFAERVGCKPIGRPMR